MRDHYTGGRGTWPGPLRPSVNRRGPPRWSYGRYVTEWYRWRRLAVKDGVRGVGQ